MSYDYARVPPLFWINDKRRGEPLGVGSLGQKAVCFFSTENKALDHAEYHLGGEPGPLWEVVGSEDANNLIRIADGAVQRGFDGWVLDPPVDSPETYLTSPWSELRDEVERKIDGGAAWGSAPRATY
jgi:hypothetical protein